MLFENRTHAGEQLAKKLSRLKLKPREAVVVGIPRGGVVVANVIARGLQMPLKVVIIKKLSAPANPELAIGAISSHGLPVLDRWLIADLGISSDYLKKEIIKKRKEARSREKFLQAPITNGDFEGRTVIVVDDGLATGQTARAAAKILKAAKAAKIILAVPCASPGTLEAVGGDFDKIVCLEERADFWAVGQFYRDFRPVSDEEVKQILK